MPLFTYFTSRKMQLIFFRLIDTKKQPVMTKGWNNTGVFIQRTKNEKLSHSLKCILFYLLVYDPVWKILNFYQYFFIIINKSERVGFIRNLICWLRFFAFTIIQIILVIVFINISDVERSWRICFLVPLFRQ